MRNPFRGSFVRSAAVAIVAVSALVSTPAVADLTGPGILVIATDDAGNVSRFTAEAVQTPDGWAWATDEPIEMWANDNLLATLNPGGSPGGLGVTYVADPVVNLNFSVQAGGSTTSIVIASALLSFPTINSPVGAASAAFSLTDANGDGATLVGIGDPAGAQGGYLAQYNGYAGSLSGTTFAEVHQMMSAAAFDTTTATVDVPGAGTTPIGVPVFDMSSVISFRLSANDLASGTTNFVITPEPSSVLLLACGLVLARRRFA